MRHTRRPLSVDGGGGGCGGGAGGAGGGCGGGGIGGGGLSGLGLGSRGSQSGSGPDGDDDGLSVPIPLVVVGGLVVAGVGTVLNGFVPPLWAVAIVVGSVVLFVASARGWISYETKYDERESEAPQATQLSPNRFDDDEGSGDIYGSPYDD